LGSGADSGDAGRGGASGGGEGSSGTDSSGAVSGGAGSGGAPTGAEEPAMAGLILDLRDNVGGDVEAGVEAARDFLGDGDILAMCV
jgi:hypothetical protein